MGPLMAKAKGRDLRRHEESAQRVWGQAPRNIIEPNQLQDTPKMLVLLKPCICKLHVEN